MNKFIFLVLLPIFIIQQYNLLAQNPGDSVFNSTQIHDIYLQFNQSNWYDSLIASHAGDFYISGNATINGVAFINIGIKFKGILPLIIPVLRNQ